MIKITHYSGLLLITVIVLVSSCRQNRNAQKAQTKDKAPSLELYKGTFTYVSIKDNDSTFRAFKNRYTPQQQHVILALNRVDFSNFSGLDTLIIPDSVWSDVSSYSTFPLRLKELEPIDKLVLFSYPVQAFAVYENGHLTRWGPTSMGSEAHPTKTGLSYANWKKEEHISTVDDEWLLRWNVNIRNKAGIGWHQYSMPGYPASHACLRLLEADARWLYDWVDEWILDENEQLLASGTPVIVFGEYDFEGQKPWLQLATDPDANDISKDQLRDIVEAHISTMVAAQEKRKKIAAEN